MRQGKGRRCIQTDDMRQKIELRKRLLQMRRGMVQKPHKDSLIFENLVALPEFCRSSLILTYVSTELEVDTRRLIDYCLGNNIAVAIPGIVDEKMKFFGLTKLWEITDEVECDSDSLCIVPGLAFNQENKRLGYGGGYYDRVLRDFCGKSVGVCYDEFIIDIPTEIHDEKVDILITEKG